ncbi:MAG TPA: flagellar export chaperone FliS [Tepidisphaeraceae bacterium]|nr:flagellar export chaperone FliS [Tepidisphaeraceae bacterium]
MNQQGAQNYLRTRVMTATPEQLQMMLFDGAVRFAELGRAALAAKNFEQSYTNLSKCQKIVTELTVTLKPDLAPDLCKNLSSLYAYVYKKLIEANVEHELAPLDEAIELLKYQRETWSLLLEKLGKEKAAKKASTLDLPGPNERMEQSIRLSA